MRKLSYAVFIICLLMTFVACNTKQSLTDKRYEIFDIADIENTGVKSWFNNYITDHGYYQLSVKDQPEYNYLLITAGYLKDASHVFEISEITEDEKYMTFKVELCPVKDAELLTDPTLYPNLLLKVKANNKKMRVEFIENQQLNDGSKNMFMLDKKVVSDIVEVGEDDTVETVWGIFLSRINDDYIKVQSGSDLLKLKFSLNSEREVGQLTPHAAIKVDYLTNEVKDLEVCALKIGNWPGTPVDGDTFDSTGVFIEFQKNHSCVISENEVDTIYWIAEEAINDYYNHLKHGDEIKFCYYHDYYGRKVILGLR